MTWHAEGKKIMAGTTWDGDADERRKACCFRKLLLYTGEALQMG